MRKSWWTLVLTLCLLLPQGGEAAGQYSFAFGGFGSRVRVTNVDNDQVLQTSGAMTDYLLEELSDCPQLVLYDRSSQAEQLRMDELVLQAQLGQPPAEYRELPTDYIICGWLNNLGLTLKSDKWLLYYNTNYDVLVDVSLRVLETKTGRTVFTATGSGRANSRENKLGIGGLKLVRLGDREFSEECYNKALRQAVAQAAAKLRNAI